MLLSSSDDIDCGDWLLYVVSRNAGRQSNLFTYPRLSRPAPAVVEELFMDG